MEEQKRHSGFETMRVIMGEEKKSDLDKVTFTSDTLRKYFPKSYTPQRMQETIIKLLGRQILMPMVDIGVSQLAMHSAMETASCKDAEYLANAVKTYGSYLPEEGLVKNIMFIEVQ